MSGCPFWDGQSEMPGKPTEGDSPHLAEHPPKATDHLPQAIMSLTELLLSAWCSLGTRMTFNPHNHAAGGYQYPL